MATNLVESRECRVKRGHPEDIETYSFAKPHIVEAILNHVSGHKGGWPVIIFMRRTDQWKTINAGGVVRLLDGSIAAPYRVASACALIELPGAME